MYWLMDEHHLGYITKLEKTTKKEFWNTWFPFLKNRFAKQNKKILTNFVFNKKKFGMFFGFLG